MEIENVLILPHALERFKERYQALNRVSLAEADLLDKLHSLIKDAQPEEEGLALQKRRQAHGDSGYYLINPPWRFVFSERGLETCEVMPENVFLVKNPYISPQRRKNRFALRIEENRRKNGKSMTRLIRLPDNTELYLSELAEINAVIRALRAIGVQVNYKRTGTQKHKAASLDIVVPQALLRYEIEQMPHSRKVRILLDRDSETFPLGLKKIICVGIVRKDLEKILKFLHIIKINKD